MNRLFSFFISIIISISLFKLFDLNLNTFLESVTILDIGILFICSSISFFLSSLRFKYILLLSSQNIKFLSSLKLTIYQNFFNSLAISGVGELVKYYKKRNIPNVIMIAAIFVEKLSGFISVIFIFLIVSVYFLIQIQNILYLFTCLVFIFLCIYFFKKNIRTNILFMIPYLHFISSTFFVSKNNIIKSYIHIFIISILIQLISITLYALLLYLRSGNDLNLLLLIITVPIINIITALPISFAGLGTRDLMGLYLFSFIGVSSVASFQTTFSIGIFSIIISIIFYLITLFINLLMNRFIRKSP
jgi:glycosyltransferase 2 family protein